MTMDQWLDISIFCFRLSGSARPSYLVWDPPTGGLTDYFETTLSKMLHNLPCMDNFFSSFNHLVKRRLILFVSQIGDCSSYPLYRSQRLSRERSTPLQRSLHSLWTTGICTLLLSSSIFVYTVSRECTDSSLQVHIMFFFSF